MTRTEVVFRVQRRISSLQWTSQHERRVLHYIQAQTSPKKRLRWSVVLALVLVMVTLVAAATVLGWRLLGERTMELDPLASSGFAGWSLENKQALVQAMRDHEMDVSAFDNLDALSQSELDTELTKRLSAYWPGHLANESGNILEGIRGPFYTWSLEDKAWFTQQLIINNRLGQADEMNLVPDMEDFTFEEAKTLAVSRLTREYSHIEENTLAQFSTYASFYSLQSQPDVKYWSITFRDAYGAIHYQAIFQADGSSVKLSRAPTREETLETQRKNLSEASDRQSKIDALEQEKGPQLFWSLEEKAELFGAPLPGAEDISLETALSIAKQAIVEKFGASQSTLDSLRFGVYFMKNADSKDCYAFSFMAGDSIAYSVEVEASTGKVLLLTGTGDGNG